MRWKAFLITTTVLATLGLVGAASPQLEAQAVPLEVATSPARAESIMAHYAEAATTELGLASGHMLVGSMTDGEFILGILPESPHVSAGATPMTRECHNDVPAYIVYAWGSSWLVPSVYSLAPNSLAPVTQNMASLGHCNVVDDTHYGYVSLLEFRTAGDYGGAIYLWGYDAFGAFGEYLIDCWPAAAGGGVGVGDTFITTLKVSDAICYVYQWGVQPSEFNVWSSRVYNYNYAAGTTYASVN